MEEMSYFERGMAALTNADADRLSCAPIACGVNRRFLNGGKGCTYREWTNDAQLFGQSYIMGQKHFGFDFVIGLMDLAVMAGDLGANVRMDEENTPFVDKHIINSVEDYEKFEVPDVKKGRSNVLIEGTKIMGEGLKGQTVTAGFIEGPLLALSQSAGAERLFMDMFTNPSAVHTALEVMTAYDVDMVAGFAGTSVNALCWDYLWGSYSCLGDVEYAEFEGDKYAKKLNALTIESGMAVAIHNCADLPHLDTQIKKFKPSLYSMAYYPLTPGSFKASEVIEQGYCDECLVAGNLDPQLFIRNTAEDCTKATANLCQEVKTALCKRGLKSRYCITSGCEIPPDIHTKIENIEAVVSANKEYGKL